MTNLFTEMCWVANGVLRSCWLCPDLSLSVSLSLCLSFYSITLLIMMMMMKNRGRFLTCERETDSTAKTATFIKLRAGWLGLFFFPRHYSRLASPRQQQRQQDDVIQPYWSNSWWVLSLSPLLLLKALATLLLLLDCFVDSRHRQNVGSRKRHKKEIKLWK
jgi:hypothetical protein